MKNLLVTFGVILSAFANAQSQLDLGIQFAPSMIYLRGHTGFLDFEGATVGYAVGGNLIYKFTPKVAICTSPGFELKGSTVKIVFIDLGGNVSGEAVIRAKFNYLIFPVLARLYLGSKQHFC